MLRRLLTSLSLLAIPVAVVIHHANLHAATPEETLAQINRLRAGRAPGHLGARSQERAQRHLVRADEPRRPARNSPARSKPNIHSSRSRS